MEWSSRTALGTIGLTGTLSAVVCLASFALGGSVGPLRGSRLFDVAVWSALVAVATTIRARQEWRARMVQTPAAAGGASSPDGRRPGETPIESAPGRLARALAGTLAGVLCINVVWFLYLDAYLRDGSRRTVSQKWEILAGMREPVDWLLLGDSSCNQGVIPEVLSQSLGGSSVNLCTIGPVTTVHQAMMLEAYVARFGAPTHLVLVNAFAITAEAFDPRVLAKAQVSWGLSPMLRFSPETISVSSQLEIAFARYLPLYYENREIRTLLRRAVEAPSALLVRPFRLALTADGYMPMHDPLLTDEAIREIDQQLSATDGIRFTDASVRGVERLVALAERYGIRTFVFTGPMYEGLTRSPLFQRYFPPVQRWWSAIAARTSHVTYVDALHTFPLWQMGDDAQHVTHVAAEIYTRQIADDIRRVEGGAPVTSTGAR